MISTEQNQEGGVLVAVRDTGPGIDPDDVERVFQSFYTTTSGGIAMGLRSAGPSSQPMEAGVGEGE